MKQEFRQEQLVDLFGETSNLFGIVQGLERSFEREGKVICRIRLNGESLSESGEVANANLSVLGISTLEVELSSPREVLMSVIGQWIESIPSVIEDCDKLAGTLRQQGLESAASSFSNLIGNCHVLVDSMDSALPFIKAQHPELITRWRQSESGMYIATKDALAAFEKKDFNTLADVIEYDLAHCLELWRELLILFREGSEGVRTIESEPGQSTK